MNFGNPMMQMMTMWMEMQMTMSMMQMMQGFMQTPMVPQQQVVQPAARIEVTTAKQE